MNIGDEDFVFEMIFKGPNPDRGTIVCERCGVIVEPRRYVLNGRPQVAYSHNAPCGRRCLPGLDTWIDGGPPHISTETCGACKEMAGDAE